ncbi:MAG: chitobiase/beta-hexosaminidase C-terminal domain-containing protein [Bacteroidaceae bacterium]|nr:chitobiase/beta-hexosaminidase C-terminal domain-containing protein [Bacteroidaceae bacterium]
MKLRSLLFIMLCAFIPLVAKAQYTVNVGSDITLYAPSSSDYRKPDLYDVKWEASGSGSVTFLNPTQSPTGVRGVSAGEVRIYCTARYYNQARWNDPLYSSPVVVYGSYTVTVVDPNGSGSGDDPYNGGGSDPGTGGNTGDYIQDYTPEGYLMLFRIKNIYGEKCAVVTGGDYGGTSRLAIDKNIEGKVTIPETAKGYPVREIANSSLQGISASELVLPKNLQYIEGYSIHGENLTTITSLNENPPVCSEGNAVFFWGFNERYDPIDVTNTMVLYVPSESAKEKYQRAAGWSKFKEYRVLEEEKEQLLLAASPAGGEVKKGTVVTLTTSNASDADIYYTLDGTTPSTNSTRYTSSGITINESCTLNAIACKDGYKDSEVLTATYTVKKESVEGYYYVGQMNSWDITSQSIPFIKQSDGKTWELTIYTETSDEFMIAPTSTTDWTGLVYGAPSDYPTPKSGTMIIGDTRKNFMVIAESGMYSYTVRIVPSTMSYEIIVHRNVQDYDVTLSNAGYATFYDSQTAYRLPSGLSASVVTGVSNGKLTYKSIADGAMSNGVIPKGVAVMLTSDNKRATTYTLTATESTETYSGTNLLKGSDVATTTTASGSNYFYKLSYGQSGTNLNDVFGWYWGAQNGAAFQIDAHKAWLVVPKSADAPIRSFVIDEETTGLADVKIDGVDNDVYYDLQGRSISKPTSKGIYIRNGKKIIIR